MSLYDTMTGTAPRRGSISRALQSVHIDIPLLVLITLVSLAGVAILYSASGESTTMATRQLIRLGIGFGVLLLMAQIPSSNLRLWAPWIFALGLGLLIVVLFYGDVGKGAQRWLNLGFVRFQPSELMKLAVPIMVAWYFHERVPPPRLLQVCVALIIIAIPVGLISAQPDLGTSLLVAAGGLFALFLAGLRWRIIAFMGALLAALAPLAWFFYLHDYQRQRILSFLNPEQDPLGAGYHIIQSKIAIGSGGLFGKGWLNGSQAHLQFLPERSTDFIFAVFAEEFGLLGALVMLGLYLLIIARGLHISLLAQSTFERLLAGSISLTFAAYLLINVGMVAGLLPVVGVPLPLVSYGGTSLVTLMAGFGILMSIHTRRSLIAH